MMRTLQKLWRSLSRRSLSVITALSVFFTMILAVVSGILFVSIAGNPTTVDALNQTAVVQEINLLPVDPDATNSRTTLKAGTNSKDSYLYADITVNSDDTVDFSITQDTTINQQGNNDTAFVEVFTKINQKINLAENPWLMLRWSGSGRCNGRIYFSVTKNGVEYGKNNTVIPSDYEDTTAQGMISDKLFAIPLSNIINNNSAGYSYTNQTQTDFNASTVQDYTIDLYKYLNQQVINYNDGDSSTSGISLSTANWPSGEQWKDSDNNYITIYMSCQILAGESNEVLTAGTNIHWEKFSLGREVLERPASLLPRSAEFMNITDTAATPSGVDYGRVTTTEDGAVTFRNTSSTNAVVFQWNLRRYFNASELESLLVNATFSGMTAEDFSLRAWYGGRTTTYIETDQYNYRGTNELLHNLISGYARSSSTTDTTLETVIDFNRYITSNLFDDGNYQAPYNQLFPDDSLIFMGDVSLTLPAGAKITFHQLEFQVENEEMPSTKADVVYPWASATSPDGLPPVGTPALSTALDGSEGVSYEWAASAADAPVVDTKVDLLALKTHEFNKWDNVAINTSTDDAVGVPYIRKTTGESIYSSSNQTDYSYYRLMRYGPSEEWTRNYYLYLDTNTTPYLYYSYELIDTEPDDGVAPSAGFYFHVVNAGRDKFNNNSEYCYLYYLDQSGIALNECNSFYSSNSYKYVAEAILSPAQERTGCVDFSSLYVSENVDSTVVNSQYLKFEEMRIYLAPGTDIQINYMFIGSASLDESVVGTIATQGGEAYPWATTKEAFDAATDPDSSSSKLTFANKIDVLDDLQDRVEVNNDIQGVSTTGIPGGTVDPDTGAVTVTVTTPENPDVNTDYYQQAGVSFDHHWRVQVPAEDDLSSIRYLNYSVDAPSGMRWAIMISEDKTDASQERAILTWADAQARYNDDNVYTAPPAGKSLFRYVGTGTAEKEFELYWKDHNNTSWRIYSVPGSQTGCVDLRQVGSTFHWDNIISIYLIAYRDPNLVLDTNETAAVTFNYLYLTSEPIAKSDVGKPAVTAGTAFSWGGTQVSAPTGNTLGNAFVNPVVTAQSATTYIDYTPYYGTQVNLQNTPYLYYSYRFVDITTGKTVTPDGTPLRVGMSIFENNTYYYFRNTGGADSVGTTGLSQYTGANRGYGNPAFVRLSTGSDVSGKNFFTENYYVYGSETGCINLADYFVSEAADGTANLNMIRFYVDSTLYANDNYEFIVDYLFLGNAVTTATSFTKTYMSAKKSAPTTADFQVGLGLDGESFSQGTETFAKAIKVDLSETPYLFYSMEYATGAKGTFGLHTDQTVQSSYVFFRDVGRSDGRLISAGDTPAVIQYMQQSETGCIDVRGWYLANGYEGDIIYISAFQTWGADVKVNYLYFGAEADKTIDLIPEKAGASLESGTPTAAWTVMTSGSTDSLGQCAEVEASDGEWDTWDESTKGSALPDTKIKFAGDTTNDGFNDLVYSNSKWSMNTICYGRIVNSGHASANTFNYISTGNNQTAGITIDLNETPYLHFSFEQDAGSATSFILQTNDYTASADLVGKSADKVRPWLSAYCPTSPAGQLIQIVSETKIISYYKDIVMDGTVKVYGSFGGVIDLRSWFTVTNGYDNVVSLERVRFYTYNEASGVPTEVKIKHFYLSSSAGAAYTVTFNKNDQADDSDLTYTQYVLQNANDQYVSDAAAEYLKKREGYTFVGWYTDEACENYFDISGTPLTGNTTLYARWIKNTDIVFGEDVKEVNILSYLSADVAQTQSGSGTVVMEKDALTITNTGTDYYVVKFPVGKAYSVEDLRSLFLGFDTDLTCEGFDITLSAKSATTRTYSLVQTAFAADFLTDASLLTAAPYDREAAFYTYLGVRDDLPVRENADGLIEISTITFTIPAGVSTDIRYIKAGNEMSLLGNTDTRAPAVENGSFDLINNPANDAAFIYKTDNVVYNTLSARSVTYDNTTYAQAALHGIDVGYTHLGGLYSYTIDLKSSSSANGPFLYYSIDQSADSYFTFALYASFSGMVEGKTSGTRDVSVFDIHTPKSVSYFSASANGLASRNYSDDAESYIPAQTAYINGSKVGVINLYDWYTDALKPYRSNSQVDSVEILGLRLYTSGSTTDTTVNYMFIGGKETELSKQTHMIYAEYPFGAGSGDAAHNPTYASNGSQAYLDHRCSLSDVQLHRGETLYVTLDDLEFKAGDAPLDDPTKVFLGWAFRDFMYKEVTTGGERIWNGKLVYWNPDATNGNEYDPNTNPGGSWSQSPYDGFVANRKTVFYTFTTSGGNTQIIVPIFGDAAYTPTLSATVEGSGTVSILNTGGVASTAENIWNAAYGTQIMLRASGDGFIGWYDQSGALVSSSKDYQLTLVADTVVTAHFAADDAADTVLEYLPQTGNSIVWLQSENGTAGTDFYLRSVNNGDIALAKLSKSNINDVTGNTQIACYWGVDNAQLLTAVAPSGYYWAQLLSDGTTVRVSADREYTFIASTNIKLIAVANDGTGFESTVIIDEFAFDDDRDDAILRFNGQVLCAENEAIVTCGLAFIDYKKHGELPSIGCAASDTVTASAWNATTGQFVVEFSIADSPEYCIRGYAVVYNTQTGEYAIRYSDCHATVF